MRKGLLILAAALCLVMSAYASEPESLPEEPIQAVDGEIAENPENEAAAEPDLPAAPQDEGQKEPNPETLTEGDLQNEIVFPAPPYAVYLVEEPPLEGETDIAPFAVGGDGYPGTISTGIYQYFRDLSAQLPVGTHYVFYRADRYIYRLVYGEDISLSGDRFTGGEVEVIEYSTYNSDNTLSRYSDSSFSFTDGGYFVYTDLGGGYPKLFEGVTSREIQTLTLIVTVGLLSLFVIRIFKY